MPKRKTRAYDPPPHCPSCGVPQGRYHLHGCEAERCPYCGETLDGHDGRCSEAPEMPWPVPLDDREVYADRWPGQDLCERHGWFDRVVGGRSVPCAATDPGARMDVNYIAHECEWSRERKRFVRLKYPGRPARG